MSRAEYMDKIIELLEKCDNLSILDVIYRILVKACSKI